MIKKIILFLFISTTFLFSQNAGNTGLSFLKNGVSANSIGSSDIGMLNSDLSSIFYNPATVNYQNSSSIMFTHQAWIQDVKSENLNANFTMFGFPFALGVNTTSIGGFEARSKATDIPDATFSVNFFYLSLSGGFSLYEDLKFGVTIKYLYESLLSDDASGTGYDFGLAYVGLIDNLTFGASVRNLGTMKKLKNEKTELPSDVIINATYKLGFDNVSLNLLPVIGIQKYFEADNLHLHVGTDVIYNQRFSIRAGYITGYDSKGLTFGAGVFWSGFNFDYAFTPFSYGLGNANTISLMYTF